MRPLTVNVINEEEAGTQRRNREIVGFERRGEDGQGGGRCRGRRVGGEWGREVRGGGREWKRPASVNDSAGYRLVRAHVWLCSFVRIE